MKAVRLHAFSEPPQFDDVPMPTAGEGQTLVRIAAACLAHIDRSIASGSFGVHPPLPYVVSTDGSGWVIQSGRFAVGTFVWLRGGGLGVDRDGVCAQYAVVPDASVHPAPDDTDPFLAACFFSPATSAHTALHTLGQLRPGQRVMVSGGAGAVGSLLVQMALHAGAAEVIATVRRPERAALVPAGAHVVVGDDPAPGLDIDLLVDTVGGAGLAGRLRCVRSGGTAVLVGYTAGTEVTLDLPTLMRQDVRLLPLNMIRRAPEAFGVAGDLLRRLSTGELALAITPLPMADIERAWDRGQRGETTGRLVLIAPQERASAPAGIAVS